MNIPMKKSQFLTLFNCINCNSNIQTGMFKLHEDDILCDNCYTNFDENQELTKKKISEVSLENKKVLFENSDLSYFNVLYEREQKENSDISKYRYFDRRNFSRDLTENTNSRNVIDFSLANPLDSNKKFLSEENVDHYINSKQYKLIRKNLSTCCICLNDFVKDDMMIKLNCNHVFHSACMLSWLNLNSSCPMCRYELEF